MRWLGLGNVLALIFGYVGLHQIRERNEGGRGLAVAGIVLGWIGLAGLLLIVVAAIAASHANPSG